MIGGVRRCTDIPDFLKCVEQFKTYTNKYAKQGRVAGLPCYPLFEIVLIQFKIIYSINDVK